MALLKTLEPLFLPSGLLFMGALVATVLVLRHRRRAALIALGLVLGTTYLLATPWASARLIRRLEQPFLSAGLPANGASAVVVLAGAAGVYPDGSPALNIASWRRAWRGIDTYLAQPTRIPLIYTGGSTNRATGAPIESPLIEHIAVRAGVERRDLIFDDKATNTFESARNIARLWPARFGDAPRRIALVTSAWHMRRSITVFQQQGFDVQPVATDYRGRGGRIRLGEWWPSVPSFALTELAWRESLSVLLYDWVGRS